MEHAAPTRRELFAMAPGPGKNLRRLITQGRVIPGQHFQWNAGSTRYDRSPCCGAEVGHLGGGGGRRAHRRCCMAPACPNVYVRPPRPQPSCEDCGRTCRPDKTYCAPCERDFHDEDKTDG
jgi:hypothetical protein